jgi:hypothetical protein
LDRVRFRWGNVKMGIDRDATGAKVNNPMNTDYSVLFSG